MFLFLLFSTIIIFILYTNPFYFSLHSTTQTKGKKILILQTHFRLFWLKAKFHLINKNFTISWYDSTNVFIPFVNLFYLCINFISSLNCLKCLRCVLLIPRSWLLMLLDGTKIFFYIFYFIFLYIFFLFNFFFLSYFPFVFHLITQRIIIINYYY